MSHRRLSQGIHFTEEEWAAHLAQDRRRDQRLADLERRIGELEHRAAPPPDWVKPNVTQPDEESKRKRGAVKGHAAHHRAAPPRFDEIHDVVLTSCSRCHGPLGAPFAVEDRVVEEIVPGHVRVTRYRVGRYRCEHCHRVRRARLPATVAPPRSRFGWGTHFLVGRWSTEGLTHSMVQDLLKTDYGLTVSSGTIDAMLRRSAELFAPAYAAIEAAVKAGKSVHVDWTGWRVDGVNHHLWDFLAPSERAAFFTVARSAGHTLPEHPLGKRRKDRVLVCDGATAFNAMSGRKQRCWVHLLRHAREDLARWESVSDAPDWRGLRVMEKIARGVLSASRLPEGPTKTAEAERLRKYLARWLRVERHGEVAQSLQKFLTKHNDELWWWADAGVSAHNNPAEQGLRPHIAKKRKLSWGSRTLEGANRFAALASVVQTGKMHGVGLNELGGRVLGGAPDPFGFDRGPPTPS